ncbi:hypothetical protein ASE25_07830 [Terrabacter sp. Root85]|uniref:hypothetical protein n=1 Tax=Terrabacter sp. Root85 TaxID=1736603 RepID=UPI0006F7A314|nr:hypothetical protein [Terrabacter sp. Root85]KRC89497.1 hypothetical protein ASE25_07830 [Terrabacter sp. Root85]
MSAARSMDEMLAEVYPVHRLPGGYGRYLDNQRLIAAVAARREREARSCAVDGCHTRSKTRGLCPMHYMRWHRTGFALGTADPRWQAAHLRPVPPTLAEIAAECLAALENLRAVVARQSA